MCTAEISFKRRLPKKGFKWRRFASSLGMRSSNFPGRAFFPQSCGGNPYGRQNLCSYVRLTNGDRSIVDLPDRPKSLASGPTPTVRFRTFGSVTPDEVVNEPSFRFLVYTYGSCLSHGSRSKDRSQALLFSVAHRQIEDPRLGIYAGQDIQANRNVIE